MAEPYVAEAPKASPQAELTGIGGWLVLIAIGQVLGPLRLIANLAITYTSNEVLQAFSKITVAMYGALLVDLFYLGVVFVTSFLFFAHKRSFKVMFTVEVFGILFAYLMTHAWVSAVTGVPVNQLLDPGEFGRMLAALLVGLVWVAYIWRSKRVRNTFVK